MSNFCSECGHALEHREQESAEADAVAEVASADVQIARINADKEIKLAQINARVVETVTEVDDAAELAHAEGKAEGMAEVLHPDPEPVESASAPVVVMNDDQADAEPEAEPVPAAEPPAEPKEHKKSSNFWGV